MWIVESLFEEGKRQHSTRQLSAGLPVREESSGTSPESGVPDGQANLTLCLCLTITSLWDRKTPYFPAPRMLHHSVYSLNGSPFNRLLQEAGCHPEIQRRF